MDNCSSARDDKHQATDSTKHQTDATPQASTAGSLIPLDPVNAVHKAALRAAAQHAMDSCTGVEGVQAYLAGNHRLRVERHSAFDAMCEVGERELGASGEQSGEDAQQRADVPSDAHETQCNDTNDQA